MDFWHYAVITILALVGVIAGVVAYKPKVSKETIDLMIKNKQALEDRVGLLEDADAEKTKQISSLEGQVTVLKTIPLKEISENLLQVTQTVTTLTTHLTQHSSQVEQATARIIEAVNKNLRT